MPGKLRCSLLCEDLEQERLFRPLLERLLRRRIRVEPRKPHGGFTFVLARLKETARYVRRRPQEAVGLLVVVDGDRVGFQGRLAEIRNALREAGIDDQEPDRIAICIPTRNIETWALWLCGVSDLEEKTDYKLRYQQEFKPGLGRNDLVEAWLTTSPERREAEAKRLPALAHGRAEIERLRSRARD
ncbi:MAG: hypothetical protein ABUT39_16155 [Acidobacteriota bacterium]